MNLYHDSRDETYRCPAGAQPCGASVRLFLQTDAPDAIVRFWVDDHAYLYPMHAVSGGFEYTFSLPEKPCIVWYYFICGGAYYGNARDNLGGPGEIYAHEPPSYQITVYDPAYETPAWMGDGVMMQIMPDRFFRGGDFPCRENCMRTGTNSRSFPFPPTAITPPTISSAAIFWAFGRSCPTSPPWG